jgi:hypothetical protein
MNILIRFSSILHCISFGFSFLVGYSFSVIFNFLKSSFTPSHFFKLFYFFLCSLSVLLLYFFPIFIFSFTSILTILILSFTFLISSHIDKYSPLRILFNPFIVLRHVFIVIGSFSHWSYSYFILSNFKGLYANHSPFFFFRSFFYLIFSFTDYGYTYLLKAILGSHFSILFARFGRFLYLYIVLLMSIGLILSFYPVFMCSLIRLADSKRILHSDLSSLNIWLSYFNRFYIPLLSSLIYL